MSSKKSRILLILLLFIAIFTRFIKLDWGDGFFFHPDENNMATAITQLRLNDLDPHFYAYGQFPLYLAYFTAVFIRFVAHQLPYTSVSFTQAIFTLRFFSAIFSVFSVYLLFLISRHLSLDKKFPFYVIILFIFSPGLIQLSHFGTTESLLILIFLANILLSINYVKHPKFSTLLLSSIISGIGLGTKLSALIFVGPILLSLLYRFIAKPSFKIIFSFIFFILFLAVFTAISSPYNLINFSDFYSSMNYETGVATGKLLVFYTNQFLNSTPYLFQLSKVFPYSSGIFMYILSISGAILFCLRFFGQKKQTSLNWSLILIPSFIYFLYFGQLYVKWFRFMSPIFFIIPLLSARLISAIKSKIFSIPLIFLSIIPGLLFLKTYLTLDIRQQFSNWFVENIPAESVILSEAGNVIDLPLDSSQYHVINFDFYNLDSNPELSSALVQAIADSDYILIPSRRIFKNQSNYQFPVSQSYYDNLFFGQLGFSPIASFMDNNYTVLNPESAEETFSVFDQPTIRLFQNQKHLTQDQIYSILSFNNQD